MKKALLALSLLGLVFTSCKKDNDEPKQITATKANLVGTYVMIAATVSDGTTTTNVFNNSDENLNWFDPCTRDDQYKLNADLSYNVIDAGTVCSPSNNSSGTWDLTNSTTFIMDGDVATIKSFDGHTIVFEYDLGGGTKMTQTLKK